MKTWKIRVLGRVQGVGYRYFTLAAAKRLSLKGWVKNNSDGSVGIIAQGEEGAINLFIHELYEGPLMASVEKVETEILEQDEYPIFTIKGW